ncbi:MAG: AI-2E family transporter [Eubacteriales bacterium]|nr:AI-2E family transporter [Eubacteriales bacterium]
MRPHAKLYVQKAGILAAVLLSLKFLLPVVLPFFLAWLTVGLLAAVRRRISVGLLPLSVLYLGAFLSAACVAACFVGYLLYEPCRDLFPVCRAYMERLSVWTGSLPASLTGRLALAMPTAASCLFQIFLYLISVLLFARDWEGFRALLGRLPFSGPVSRAGRRMIAAVKGWARAQVRIMFVITLECAAGYYLLRIPGAGLWAVLTGMIDALPVFGTGTVFVPWILIVVLKQRYELALWLALLYALTWLTREFLEPKLLGNGLGLLPVCFLMSVAVGLQLFGALGLFTGPFGVLLIRELWAELETSAPSGNPSAPLSGDDGT